MSETYRQTISDELADAIDARRGLLSRQEYTTFALAAALEQPTLAELQRQIDDLRAQLGRPQVTMPAARPSVEMLAF